MRKVYKTKGKSYYQQQYKTMIEAEMVSTHEGCTENIPMTPNPFVSTKKPIVRKPLSQFSDTLYVHHKTAVHCLCAERQI